MKIRLLVDKTSDDPCAEGLLYYKHQAVGGYKGFPVKLQYWEPDNFGMGEWVDVEVEEEEQ